MKATRLLRHITVAALFVVLFEAGARRYSDRDPTVLPDPYLGLPGTPPLYRLVEPDEGFAYYERSPNKATHYRDARFLAEKHESEYRVFCIGGSSVQSSAFTDPDGSFSNMLWIYLTGAMRTMGGDDRTLRPNVINAGGGGMGSIQNLEVLREVLNYQPDLLVVYPEGGEKNFIGNQPRAVLAKKDDASPFRAGIRRVLAQFRIYQAVRDGYRELMPKAKQEGVAINAFSAILVSTIAKPFDSSSFTRLFEMKNDRVPPLMKRTIPEDEIQQAYTRFRRNLTEMATLAREHEVPLLFVLPVRNLKQSFYLRFHMTPEEIKEGEIEAWKAFYDAGCTAKREKRYGAALEAFRRVRNLYVHDDDDILAFYMGECYEALGRKEEALVEYSRPYLSHPMLAQIREIAAQEQVPLIDPYPPLVAAARGEVPGYDWFTDAFHPMPNTNRVLAKAILDAMREHGLGGSLWETGTPNMNEAEDALAKLIASCEPPIANRMLKQMLDGNYNEVVRMAEDLGDQVFVEKRYVEPLYHGWALMKLGRVKRAEALYNQLRRVFWEILQGKFPSMETDHEVVTVAFEGDLFHFF